MPKKKATQPVDSPECIHGEGTYQITVTLHNGSTYTSKPCTGDLSHAKKETQQIMANGLWRRLDNSPVDSQSWHFTPASDLAFAQVVIKKSP